MIDASTPCTDGPGSLRLLRAIIGSRAEPGIYARLRADERAMIAPLVVCSDRSGETYAHIDTIARLAGLSPRSARRAMQRLIARGLVVQTLPDGDWQGRRDRRPTLRIMVPMPDRVPVPHLARVQDMAPMPDQARTHARSGSAPMPDLATLPTPLYQDDQRNDQRNDQRGDLFGRRAKTIELPPELATAEFAAAWAEWIAYRRAARKTLTPQTMSKQLAMLAEHGAAAAAAMIEQSIASGWAGLFPHEEKNGKHPKKNQHNGIRENLTVPVR